jgi:hypothetical protein
LDDFVDIFDIIFSEYVVELGFQLPLSLLILKKSRRNDKE